MNTTSFPKHYSAILLHSLSLAALTLLAPLTQAETISPSISDIPFATLPGRQLMLNLFLPKDVKNPRLVVYIHGGGWRSGNRKECSIAPIVNKGYAVASIDYRLSTEAVFPAQIYDCKGAIRWLRAHAKEYGYDASSIAVTGASAGGHLALLLGTSNNDKDLEGDVGGNLQESSSAQAIIDYFGPADFIQRSKDQPNQTEQKSGKVYQLLGGPVHEKVEMAKLASGAYHITQDDPPLLIFHGTADKTVFINQSERVYNSYKELGLDVTLHKVEGAAHGGPQFFTPENLELAAEFLNSKLGKAKANPTATNTK
jgi:acetyl esterase/lipase